MSSTITLHFFKRAFTLLELILVVATMTILTVGGVGSYRNFGKNKQLTSTAEIISADIRYAQSKAMIGDGGYKWGVHFVSTTTKSYYETFSTLTNYASGTTTATTTLSDKIIFSDPTMGNSKDILFSKISGNTTATSVSITSEGLIKTINVSAIGTVY